MKNTYLIILATLFLSFCSLSAQEPKYAVNFKGVDPVQALDIYASFSGFTLIKDSHIRFIQKHIRLNFSVSSKSQAMNLLKKALIEQAGIVITRLDSKRASVTYNDALPIAQEKH